MGKFLDSTGLTKLVELIKGSLPGKATSSTLGLVKPDNSTITVDSDGVISSSGGTSYTLPTASTSTLGGVKVDGSTITISNDIISANVPSYTAGTGISISGTTIAVDRTLPPTVPSTEGYYVLKSVEGPSHMIWSWQSTVRSELVSTETSPSMNNNINWVYG